MRRSEKGGCGRFGMVLVAATAVGCAHHQLQSPYAYAPPYAPPVYPQPHSATQPLVAAAPQPAPVVAMPPGAVMPPPVAAPVVSGVAGPVVSQGVPPCPQIPGATLIGSSDTGSAAIVGGQTPPCPPSP